MGYEFFVSYTRSNDDAFLQQFIDDLSEEIRVRRGFQRSALVRFLDHRNLELGEDWDHGIVEALQTTKVVLAIASPAYFRSQYCGKEWALFSHRLAQHQPRSHPLPPLLKPIIWVPFEQRHLPDHLKVGQFCFGDPQQIYNEKGFRYLLKQKQDHNKTYVDLIENLAAQIIEAADKHPLAPLKKIPTFQEVKSAFEPDANVLSEPAIHASTMSLGPKHVRFIYVAANPDEFGNARAREPYLETGGADWKPFFPQNCVRVHRFIQNLVASDELDFTSNEMPFTQNLLSDIDDAWEKRQIVILLVDGWTLQWSEKYRRWLRDLDRRLEWHCSVLVPWNQNDQDSLSKAKEINLAVSETFDRHANILRNPMYFRHGLKTLEELGSALLEILTYLKEEIRRRAPVEMPVPIGPSKVVVSSASTND